MACLGADCLYGDSGAMRKLCHCSMVAGVLLILGLGLVLQTPAGPGVKSVLLRGVGLVKGAVESAREAETGAGSGWETGVPLGNTGSSASSRPEPVVVKGPEEVVRDLSSPAALAEFVEIWPGKGVPALAHRVEEVLYSDPWRIDCIVPRLSREQEHILSSIRRARRAGVEVRLATPTPGDRGMVATYRRLGIQVSAAADSGYVQRTLIAAAEREILCLHTCRSTRKQIGLVLHLTGNGFTEALDGIFKPRGRRALVLRGADPGEGDRAECRARVLATPRHRVDQMHKVFLGAVKSARKSVWLIGVRDTNREVVRALLQKGLEGVEVRGLIGRYLPLAAIRRLAGLNGLGVSLRVFGGNADLGFRAALIDGEKVLTGSGNFFEPERTTHGGELFVVDHPEFCRVFSEQFEEMWRVPVNP